MSYGRWDSHGSNFDLVRDHGSKLDQSLSALIDDLSTRGMLDDVTIIVWGEFGRTPKINKDAGRDHWPQVNSALLVGGGMKKLEQSGRPMSQVLPKKARWIKERATTFFPEENRLVTASGEEINYEYLVIAMGLQLDYNKVDDKFIVFLMISTEI